MKTSIRPIIIVLLLSSALMVNSQVPLLSSHPSSQAVVFLDFDGQAVTGTSWNYNGPIACEASGLNNSQITEVFNRVAEDYRPFDINITTDSLKFLAAPANKRMRVILTVTSAWYGAAGGVAFIGSFTWGDDNPCFVFSGLLGYNVKNISEAASHETGHTLGLYHQSTYDVNCVKISDYNPGIGSGEISWAPIMGVGYYRNVTTWYNGPNPYGCTNYQNELDIITGLNGFGYRTDDYSNTFAGATSLGLVNNEFQATGMIEKNSDADVFKFTMPMYAPFHFDASPYNVGSNEAGSNLDIQVTLYNSSNTAIRTYNPDNLLNTVFDTLLNAGTYYIKVEASGNQYLPAYASLGSYSLLGRVTPGNPLPLRKLELRGVLNADKHELSWVVEANEQITQQVVEISSDGRNFQPLTQSPNDARSYSYRPSNPLSAQYRLNLTLDNGRQYFSNIVSIRQSGTTPRPQLTGTLIRSNTIVVSSPGNYNYQVIDINGKMIAKGQLISGINNINSDGMNSGLYMIRFADHTQQWTDKFIRQ
jgi:hypothetical protein